MSGDRILKSVSGIQTFGEEVILTLKIYKSGKLNLDAPQVHPRDTCKILLNLATDLMFQYFQEKEQSRIEVPKTDIVQ